MFFIVNVLFLNILKQNDGAIIVYINSTPLAALCRFLHLFNDINM